MAGYCDKIKVELLADGGCRVTDNGRGIPVDIVKGERKPAVEVVLTTLHAGGKFGGKGYQVSGGLHGVGVSVVNALSERLEVEVARRRQAPHPGVPAGQATGEAQGRQADQADGHDGHVLARPRDLHRRARVQVRDPGPALREMAFLTKGLEIQLIDARVEPSVHETFRYTGGIVDFVKHLNGSRDPVHKKVVYFEAKGEDHELEIAMQWTSAYTESVFTFANNINTHEGGMHEEGFRRALTRVVTKYARDKGILKEKDEALTGEDAREGSDGDRLGEAPEPSVRRSDEDEAR